MNEMKSNTSNKSIIVEYCEEVNLVEISIVDTIDFDFVHLDKDKVEHLIQILTEFKNHIK